jgi:hypothetical protein
MSVSCEFCVLSGRGLCDGPVTCPGESYRVCECDRETSIIRRPWPTRGCCAMEKRYLFSSLFMKYLFQYYIRCTFLCWTAFVGIFVKYNTNFSRAYRSYLRVRYVKTQQYLLFNTYLATIWDPKTFWGPKYVQCHLICLYKYGSVWPDDDFVGRN